MAVKGRLMTNILCVLVLLSTAALPLVTAPLPIEIYGYIHLDDGGSVTQLSNHPITITNERTSISQEIFTDSYGYYYLAPTLADYNDPISVDVAYLDHETSNMIYGHTTVYASDAMRVDPTIELLTQECVWYENVIAPEPTYSPHSDQTVIDLYFSQEFAFEGDMVTIYADVKNVGFTNLAEPTTVRFYDGGTLIPGGEVILPSLPMDYTEIIQIVWIADSAEMHSIRAVVGEERAFAEVRMINNEETENYIVLTFGGDYDNDQLTNWEEYATIGTSPIDSDTDDDDLPDGWEFFNGLSPLNDGRIDPIHGPNGDQDGDGLLNCDEFSNTIDTDGIPSSDPWIRDTDGDGFTDFEEFNGIPVSGGETSWFEQFESGKDYEWYIERSDENNLFGLSNRKYVSSPYALYLETTSGGTAYGTTPTLDIDLSSDYWFGFHFRLADDTNDWLETVMNGHVRLVIDSSNNLCYMQGTNPEPIELLDAHEWYYIRCEVSPSTSSYDVYIDDTLEQNDVPLYDIGLDHLRFGGPFAGQITFGKAYWDNIFIKYTTKAKLVITDPTNLDTDYDGLNDDVEINTYGTDPSDYDSDDDSFLPFYDFNDGIETTYWIGKDYTPAEAGLKAKNRDVDLDTLSDGFEMFVDFDPDFYEVTNVQWQLDTLDKMHVVWQEESSPYEVFYMNNVASGTEWNAAIQLTDTPGLAVSVQPRISLTDTKVFIEWISVDEVTPGVLWQGKWHLAETTISPNYGDEDHPWHLAELYNWEGDESYAFVYPPPGVSEDPVITFPPAPTPVLAINPDDYTDIFAIEPIDPSDYTIPWEPEPIDIEDLTELVICAPIIEEIITYIEGFEPGNDDYSFTGPTPGEVPLGTLIFAVLDLSEGYELDDFDPIIRPIESPSPPQFSVDPAFGEDYDGDGLLDTSEDTTYGTYYNDIDSDNDFFFSFPYLSENDYTFNDGDERDYYLTNSLLWDYNYDGDGIGNNLLDPDMDGDGMWDGWELYFGFEPHDDGVIDYKPGETADFDNGPDGDPDNDLLSNLDEYIYKTDPTNEDTDGDGLKDGAEVNTYNTLPNKCDTDGDGLWDGWHDDNNNLQWDPSESKGELGDSYGQGTYGTLPDNPDSDDDGLNDGDEITYLGDNDLAPGLEMNDDTIKNQLDPDSDGDGILDGNDFYWKDSDNDLYCNALDTESDGDGIYDFNEDLDKDGTLDAYPETNPANPDTDGDGLWDGWHDDNDNLQWDPSEDKGEMGDIFGQGAYGTDPTDEDTDDDNFWDGSELNWWDSNWNYNYDEDDEPNNLLDPDSDADGLRDGVENFWYKTKMENKDSDGDGLWDGWKDVGSGDPNNNHNGEYDIGELFGEIGDINDEDAGGLGTDPKLMDTDDDGLNDGDEYNYWETHSFYDIDNNIAHWDSDHDEDGDINILDWDSDGDMINDNNADGDSEPAKYNDVDGTPFNYDAIIVDSSIEVSVAIDYTPDSAVKPDITPGIPLNTLNAGLSKYFDVSTTSTNSFNAIIKVVYSTPLPSGVHEGHIRMYKWEESVSKWKIESDTNVDTEREYIWSKVTEFSTRGCGDTEEEDSDDDTLTDCEEITGYSTPGYYYNDAIYGNNFVFKTNPRISDTDNDGVNDNLDLIPLDYDMDGDGQVNSFHIVDALSLYSPDHFGDDNNNEVSDVIEADANLEKDGNGDYIDDPDMDGDNINDDTDVDDDNDGMTDDYEFSHGVLFYGWQNQYIHNRRYALLIGGGATDDTPDKEEGQNYDAFWKDPRDMYKVLRDNYNYEEKDIYFHFWDRQKGEHDGVYVDGPGAWIVKPEDKPTWGTGVKDTFDELSTSITKNDFFFFLVVNHGGPTGFNLLVDYIEGDTVKTVRYDVKPNDPDWENLKTEFNNLRFSRAVIVLTHCDTSDAIPILYGENRIVITSDGPQDDWSYTWENFFPGSETWDDHMEFLYNNQNNGFIYSLKNDGIISIKEAFVDGYNAAIDDDFGEINGDISHPNLDDNGSNNGMSNNGADGIGVEKDGLWGPGGSEDMDGWWAHDTYL